MSRGQRRWQLSHPPMPCAASTPVLAAARAAQPVCSTQQSAWSPFPWHCSPWNTHTSSDLFCCHLSLLRSRHRTKNNSPRQEPHLQPDSHIPAGPNPSPQAEHGFKICCERLKCRRPWRCILAWETAELQITGRGEQQENNRDGWAELGAAYARACTWHGQPGRAGGDGISL